MNIPLPPDFVFKYRGNRLDPSQQVMEQDQSMFVFEGMKYPSLVDKDDAWFAAWGIEKKDLHLENISDDEYAMGGQLAYFQGTPYPAKGHPFPQALYAINFAKRVIVIGIKSVKKDMALIGIGFLFSRRKNKISMISRLLQSYTEISMKVVQPYILHREFMSSFSRELYDFIVRFLTKIGIEKEVAENFSEIFANLLEYDNAYRFRAEDALSETSKKGMAEDPRRELARLVDIIKKREPDARDFGNAEKFSYPMLFLRKLLLVPSIRKAFRECIEESDFKNFQLDEADRYHILLWGDYDFLGKPVAERIKMYEEMHKGKLPPRLIYKAHRQ